jgi:hypothetical protein
MNEFDVVDYRAFKDMKRDSQSTLNVLISWFDFTFDEFSSAGKSANVVVDRGLIEWSTCASAKAWEFARWSDSALPFDFYFDNHYLAVLRRRG